MTDTLAEIAARYGAIIPDGLEVTVIPKGVSSIPYPVWREAKGNVSAGLYVPDGEKQFRAAMWNHVPKPKKPKPVKEPKPKGAPKPIYISAARADGIRNCHAAGMTNHEIAAALGSTYFSIKRAVRGLGLKPNAKRKTNNGE